MAFAGSYGSFPRINAALGVKDEDEQNANIFGNQSLDPAAAEGQAGQPALQGGAQAKSSTEGDLGSGGGGGASTSSEAMPQAPQRVSGDVVRKNVGKMTAPKAVTDAQTSLTGANTALQAEADSYMAGANAVDTNVNDTDVDNYVNTGDETSGKRLTGLLTNTDLGDYQEFQPKTDTDIEDVYEMNTDAGVKGMLRRDADEQYNAGEAALDMQLLHRDGDFNRIRSALQNDQAKLHAKRDEMTGGNVDGTTKSLRAQATDIVKKEREGEAQSLRDRLASRSGGIQSSLETEAAAENAARAAARATPDADFLRTSSDAARAEMLAELQQTDPELAQYLQDQDTSQFYGVGGDLGWRDLATTDHATKFERIMAALGGSDSLVAGKGKGERQGFDAAGFKEALRTSASTRRTNAQKLKDDMAKGAAFSDQMLQAFKDMKAKEAEAAKVPPAAPPAGPEAPKNKKELAEEVYGPGGYVDQGGKEIDNASGKPVAQAKADADKASKKVDKATGGLGGKAKKKLKM